MHDLALSQPFVAPLVPQIQSVSANNTTVAAGANVTFTIHTNLDVENVWVRAANGSEHNATRSGTATATRRTWTVTFNPGQSGNVTVFANTTRTETGAVTRTQNITVGTVAADIIGTPTAVWNGTNTTINVTTNEHTETVWAVMQGGNRVQLNRTNPGATGNRTWSAVAADTSTATNITIGVSNQTGNVNNLVANNTRGVVRTSTNAHILSINPNRVQLVNRGNSVNFFITTAANTTITISGGAVGYLHQHMLQQTLADGTRVWLVQIMAEQLVTAPQANFVITATAPGGQSSNETITVIVNN
jgi:hypothetical protein